MSTSVVNAIYDSIEDRPRLGQGETAWKCAHIPHNIKAYPGERHSFINDQGSAYDAAASADAWQRILAFSGERHSALASQPKSAEALLPVAPPGTAALQAATKGILPP